MQTLSLAHAIEMVEHIAINSTPDCPATPVMLWGPPGVGKSQGIAQLVTRLGGILVDIRLSQYDSVDLRGIPEIRTGWTVWTPPIGLPFVGNPNFPTDRLIVLFLDEICGASIPTQAVGYQLVNDRAVGEHQLLDNVRIVAASNRDGDRGAQNRMALPLANRLTHAEVGSDAFGWCLHAQDIGLDPMGVAFIQFRKELLNTFDPTKMDKAFATERTWEKALRVYADPSIPVHIKQASIAGQIGDGPAAEFWGFVDVVAKLPNMAAIARDPLKALLPDEASARWATSVAVSGYMTALNAAAMHRYLQRMDVEYIVLAWHLALRRDNTLYHTPEFLLMATKFAALFRTP